MWSWKFTHILVLMLPKVIRCNLSTVLDIILDTCILANLNLHSSIRLGITIRGPNMGRKVTAPLMTIRHDEAGIVLKFLAYVFEK